MDKFDNWVCYCIFSLDSNDTYIGSTNNFEKRLNAHNNNDLSIKRKGAKRTKGQTWIPLLIISRFHHKNACLSFEAGWKRLSMRRVNTRLFSINQMTNNNLQYTSNTKWNRVIDLLYFVYNTTLLDTKFKLNYDMRHPLFQYPDLTLNVFSEGPWICSLPWPAFISTLM